jgi:ectoine hydroxylase-related dioxygenase (phytanoyl-CoA dioxygenase family)
MAVLEHALTHDQIRTFRAEGALVVHGFLSGYWMQVLDKAYGEVVDLIADRNADPLKLNAKTLIREGGTRDSQSLKHFLCDSPAGSAAAAAMDSKGVWLYEDLLLVKEAGQYQASIWHQDTPHWPVTGTQLCSVWVSLEKCTVETGAMTMVKGSHKGPLYTPGDAIPIAHHHLIEEEAGGPLPDISAHPDRFSTSAYETEPGDVVLFHPSMLHSSFGIARERPRRTFTFLFIGDDTRWKSRPRPLIFQKHIQRVQLPDGARVIDPAFPQIWPPEMQSIQRPTLHN